jgi:hypothetical protein
MKEFKNMKNWNLLPIFSLYYVLISSVALYSQSPIPSLYVGEITPRDLESASLSPKIRSQIVISILKIQKGKYNVLDDELIRQLSDKVAKMQKQGCDDTECRRALDLAINWDEKIIGEIGREGDKFTLLLKIYKMDKENFQPSVKSSLYESFHPYQLDFYVKEMSRALMDLNYSPDYSRAPKKEGEKIEDKPIIEWNLDKSFWGNIVFPGYNRISKDDSSGYILGSVWTASLLGMAASYPSYASAKNSYDNSARNRIIYPLLVPTGSETLGSLYAIGQRNALYEDAYSQGRILNGLGIIALGVWTYSWFYNIGDSKIGMMKIPNSEWNWNFSVMNRSERSIQGNLENHYVLQFSRGLE